MSKPTSFAKDQDFHRFRALMGQAVSLQQKGDFKSAESMYSQILAEMPDQPDALHYLGLLKHQTGNGTEAVRLMKKGLETGLPNAGHFYNLGGVLQQQGQLLEAVEYLQKAVALAPSHGQAWNRLGEVHEDMGMLFKACACYRKAHEVEPDITEFTVNLIRLLHQTGELAEAVRLCEARLQAHPGDSEIAYLLTQCLMDSDKTDEALEKLRIALRADPLLPQLHHGMGMLLSELGRFDEARESFTKALSLDPQYYGAYFSLSTIRNFAGAEAEADDLEKKLRQSAPKDPLARVFAEFAIGKMLDDQERYESAFTHFEMGNKIMRGLLRYSTSAQKAYVDSLIKHLNSDFMGRQTSVGLETERPIFIVGMLRSGTSLVEQILSGHPDVQGGGELMYLPQALRRHTETPTVVTGDRIAALSDETLRAIGQHYLDKITEVYTRARHVTDKLPGNFMMVGLIRTLFPHARIIHCTRDPLDTCLSCFLTHFDGGQPYAYDLQEIGEYYRMYQEVMDHYQALAGHENLFTLRYEELIQDIDKGARQLLDFCGLEWNAACTDFSKTERVVKTASLYQVRQSPYTRSIGRWKHYESHLGPLRRALGNP